MNQELVRSAYRTKILAQKYSPELLLGASLFGFFSTIFLTWKAANEYPKWKSNYYLTLAMIEDAKNLSVGTDSEYPDEMYNKDIREAQITYAIGLLKTFGPVILMSGLSIGAVLGSHNIISSRNAALIGAYKLLDEGFKEYRKRVIDDAGEDKDREYRYGMKKETSKKRIKELSENNEDLMAPWEHSIYARWFDEKSPYYKKTDEMNLFFLRGQQNYANELLSERGHIFLNEVYDSLGIERTAEGALVGWVLGNGDGYIKFGITDPGNESVWTIDGKAVPILLDFNVDGVIWDLLPR